MSSDLKYGCRTLKVAGRGYEAQPIEKLIMHGHTEELLKANPNCCGVLVGHGLGTSLYVVENFALWKTETTVQTVDEIETKLRAQLSQMLEMAGSGLYPVGIFLTSENPELLNIDIQALYKEYHAKLSLTFTYPQSPVPAFVFCTRGLLDTPVSYKLCQAQDSVFSEFPNVELKLFWTEIVPISSVVTVTKPLKNETFEEYRQRQLYETELSTQNNVSIAHFMVAPRPGMSIMQTTRNIQEDVFCTVELRAYTFCTANILQSIFFLQLDLIHFLYQVYNFNINKKDTNMELSRYFIPFTRIESLCYNALVTNIGSKTPVYHQQADIDKDVAVVLGENAGTEKDKGLIMPKSEYTQYCSTQAAAMEVVKHWEGKNAFLNNSMVDGAVKRNAGHSLLHKALKDPNNALLIGSILGLILSYFFGMYVEVE